MLCNLKKTNKVNSKLRQKAKRFLSFRNLAKKYKANNKGSNKGK